MSEKTFTWDYREQPPMAEIAAAVAELSDGTVRYVMDETGSDEYALTISRSAPQSAPELQIAPCPVEGHDGDHLQARTGGTWMCADVLARAFAANGVTAAEPQSAPAAHKPPKLHAHPDDRAEEWLAETFEPDDSPMGVGYDRGHMIDAFHAGWDEARKLTTAAIERERQPQPAPELAAAMVETRRCRELVTAARDRLTALAVSLELSAGTTEPSRKSDIERQAARRIRDIAAGLED